MKLKESELLCASSASPRAIWAFLFNFPCPVGQCDQGSWRKMWVSSCALEIFLFTCLDWPDFHFAEYLFLLWMSFKKLWDMDSSYIFMLTTMQKDSDRQFQERQNASRIDRFILLSIRMLCGIRQCCGKNYENGVIVFYATSSYGMCMFQIFASKSAQFRMWTKSLTLN